MKIYAVVCICSNLQISHGFPPAFVGCQAKVGGMIQQLSAIHEEDNTHEGAWVPKSGGALVIGWGGFGHARFGDTGGGGRWRARLYCQYCQYCCLELVGGHYTWKSFLIQWTTGIIFFSRGITSISRVYTGNSWP